MKRWLRGLVLVVAGQLWLAGAAQAHLMVAQKGTLNFKGHSAYFVASLPVSAFRGFDDDGDRLLSLPELRRHAPLLQQQVVSGAQLRADGRAVPFELLVLDVSPPDDAPSGPAAQMLVMGRFVLQAVPAAAPVTDFRFSVGLFGTGPSEHSIELVFTRENRTQVLSFSSDAREHALFQEGFSLLAQQVRSGAGHVLGGADHMLFLMVVLAEALAARRGWRHGAALITAFTLGHGTTVAGTAMGWFSLAPSVVEPAIAASIVVMALCTIGRLRRGVSMAAGWQLLLVSGCALVHGLGLGDALRGQGWSSDDLPWALAGFNLGVELAQLGVAAGFVLVLLLCQRMAGPRASPALAKAASISGAVLGAWWLWVRMAALG